MPAENLEIETLVLIDGEPIDFLGAPGEVNISQFAAVTIGSPTADIDLTQFAAVTVGSSFPDTRMSQFAAVVIMAQGRRYLNLGPVIPLSCWSPCDSFATDVDYINWR